MPYSLRLRCTACSRASCPIVLGQCGVWYWRSHRSDADYKWTWPLKMRGTSLSRATARGTLWLWVYSSSERDAMHGTHRCRSVCASSSDHAHSKSSVGMPGVPTTVSSLENFVESLDGIHFGKVTG